MEAIILGIVYAMLLLVNFIINLKGNKGTRRMSFMMFRKNK